MSFNLNIANLTKIDSN